MAAKAMKERPYTSRVNISPQTKQTLTRLRPGYSNRDAIGSKSVESQAYGNISNLLCSTRPAALVALPVPLQYRQMLNLLKYIWWSC